MQEIKETQINNKTISRIYEAVVTVLFIERRSHFGRLYLKAWVQE